MTRPAEDVAVKGECSCFSRDKMQRGDFPRGDIGANPEARAVEPVQPVQRGEFQDNGDPLFYGYRAGVVFISFCRNLDDLLGFIGNRTHFRKKGAQKENEDGKNNGRHPIIHDFHSFSPFTPYSVNPYMACLTFASTLRNPSPL
jgi:hypothetical protein